VCSLPPRVPCRATGAAAAADEELVSVSIRLQARVTTVRGSGRLFEESVASRNQGL